jgi:DNA polymerase (family 10)
MPDNNTHIAGISDEIADMLDVQGANFFRVRAYHQAARQLRSMSEDIAHYIAT